MMKKFVSMLAFLLAFVFLLQLASCAKKDPVVSGTTTTTTTSDEGYIDESTTSGVATTTVAGTTSKTSGDGNNIVVDAKKVVLPKFNLTNKKIKLAHPWDSNQPWLKDWMDAFKKNYGASFENVYISDADKITKLAAMKASGTSPDVIFAESSMDWPMLITNDLVLPLDDKIDFGAPLWSVVKPLIDMTKYNGKTYFGVTEMTPFDTVCYNKKALRDAGLEEPRSLFYKGQWTWTKFLEYAQKLTLDTNGDGVTDQYGFATVYAEGIINSTGKDFISIDGTGKYSFNFNDPNIIRAMDFIKNLGPSKYNVVTFPEGNKMFEDLKRGKIAMIMQPNPQLYLADAFKARTVSYAPVPRDPKASKYYEPYWAKGFYICKGAKNPVAAAAFIASTRYVNIAELNPQIVAENKALYGISDDDNKLEQQRFKTTAPVIMNFRRLMPTIMYSTMWGNVLKQGTAWSSVVQENQPKINALLSKLK